MRFGWLLSTQRCRPQTHRFGCALNRTRILFNLQGSHGKAAVWAEVSDKMAPDQFVYLVAQDLRTGRMFTIEDNRALAAAGMTPGQSSAMEALLRGNR